MCSCHIPKTPKPDCLPQSPLAVLAQMWRGLKIPEGSMPAASFPRADDRQGRGDQPGPHQDGHPGLHQDGHPPLLRDDRPHQEPDQNWQVLCAGQRPHNEEQCNLEACVYSDNPEIKANLDQDYIQTDPYLKVEITLMLMTIKFDLDCMVPPRLSHLEAKIQRRFLPTNVFTCFCGPDHPASKCFDVFLLLAGGEAEGGRASHCVRWDHPQSQMSGQAI